MKKKYSKKQLAQLIIDANPDIFIPIDSLVDDLDSVYKIRKIAIKIINNEKFCISLLKNMLITVDNVFGKNKNAIISIVLNEEEIAAVVSALNNAEV